MLYETAFENKRKTVVDVFEYGQLLVRLQPGETRHVESRSPKTSYARWSRVTFKDGKIDFDENREWRWPFAGMLALEFCNVDGTATEGLQIAGETYQADRGIPKLIPVSPYNTPWCFVEKIERKLVEHKERSGDYFIKKKVLEDVKILRSKKECKEIERKLEEAAVLKARAEVQAKFLKSAE
jgi:hypothetical protein